MVRRFFGGFVLIAVTIAFGVLCGTGLLFGLFTGAEEAMIAGVIGLPNPLRKPKLGDSKATPDR